MTPQINPTKNFQQTWHQQINRLFGLVLGLFSAWLLFSHYHLIIQAYPLELREANMLSTTWLLLQGQNPFGLEFQPAFTNVYGIVYNLLVWPLSALAGESGLVQHRIVAAVFIWLSCYLLFAVMRRLEVKRTWAFAGALLFYASLLYFITPLARPDSTGLFIFLLAVFLPLLRNDSYATLVAAAFLGVLGFYVKAYFILALPALSLYLLLFAGWKKFFVHGFAATVFFALSIAAVDALLPHYFSNVLFNHLNVSSDVAVDGYLQRQLSTYARYHYALFVGLALLLLGNLLQKKYTHLSWRDLGAKRRALKPLALPLCAGFLTTAVIVFKLGHSSGAWMTYLFQLMSPFLIVPAVYALGKSPVLFPLPALIFLLNLYTAAFQDLPDVRGLNDSHAEWRMLEELLEQKTHVFATPLAFPFLLQQNKTAYDNGSSEYFRYSAARNGLWGRFFKEDSVTAKQNAVFLANLQQHVIRQNFELVVLSNEWHPLLDTRLLAQHYRLFLKIPLYLSHSAQRFELLLWEPRHVPFVPEQKRALYQKLYTMNPQSALTNKVVGELYDEVLGDKEQAIFHLQKVLDIFNAGQNRYGFAYLPAVTKRLAKLYVQQGAYEAALKPLGMALLLDGEDTQTLLLAGQAYQGLGQHVEAAKYFKKVEKITGNSAR